MDTTRVSVTVPKSVKSLLQEKANQDARTMQDVIREYVASGLFEDGVVKAGGTIFYELNGDKRVLADKWGRLVINPQYLISEKEGP